MLNDVKGIHKTVELSRQWLTQIMSECYVENENKAFVILRATLWTLRDRIPVGEAIHLGSQLPALLRGFYYEGWNLNSQSRERNETDFLLTVRNHLQGHDDIDLTVAVPACLKVIADNIDRNEAEEVKHCLPKPIQRMWP